MGESGGVEPHTSHIYFDLIMDGGCEDGEVEGGGVRGIITSSSIESRRFNDNASYTIQILLVQ